MSESLKAAALQDHYCRNIRIPVKTRHRSSNTAGKSQSSHDKVEQFNSTLSLAQKLNLVDMPPGRLSVEEWAEIKAKSVTSTGTCPICLDRFKLKKQVILNCSHTYHESCWNSYSKHLKLADIPLKCALCRLHVFDFTDCDHGRLNYINECAVKIQSFYRGSCTRSALPHVPGSYLSRKRILSRLRMISSRVNQIQNNKENTLTLFLERIKKTSETAARETRVSLRLLDQIRDGREIQKIPESEWSAILIAAIERDETECAICLDLFSKTQVTLLSCTHCFHSACIAACEKIGARVCPVCRHEYSAISFNANFN